MFRILIPYGIASAVAGTPSAVKLTDAARLVPIEGGEVPSKARLVRIEERANQTLPSISANAFSLLAREQFTRKEINSAETLGGLRAVALGVSLAVTFIAAVLALYWSSISPLPEARNLASLAILLVLYILIQLMPQNEMYMLPKNVPYHSYPVITETVPHWVCVLILVVCPLVVVGTLFLTGRMMMKAARNVIVCYVLTMAWTVVITEFLKREIGRPRPDFFGRCLGNDALLSLNVIWARPGYPSCNEGVAMYQAYKSFPSGHSSESFAGLTQLSFVLIGNFNIFDGKANGIALLASIMPIVMAAWIAASRVNNFRHFTSDVVLGGLIGTSLSVLVFLNSFGSILHPTYEKPEIEEECPEPDENVKGNPRDRTQSSVSTLTTF